MLNFLIAKFDEDSGLWAYKISQMSRLYLRGWFTVDLVSASLSTPQPPPAVHMLFIADPPPTTKAQGKHRVCFYFHDSERRVPMTCLPSTVACVASGTQLSIIPFDMVGFSLDQSSISQLKVLRVIRLLRLVKLIRIAKATRCVHLTVRSAVTARP